MQEQDLEQVQEIDRLSFAMPWPAKAYRYELKENPNSYQWVAEVERVNGNDGFNRPEQTGGGQVVVGMVVMWMILDEAHIATIAVRPGFRGRGIAQKLMAAALMEAVQHGASQATLEVRAGNVFAQKLYRRFGFEIVGSRPRYYKDNNEDALIMTVVKLETRMME